MTRRQTILPRRWATAVLAAALVASAAAGGAALQGCAHKAKSPPQQARADYDAYRKRIREVIKDPARADQMIALADELQGQVDQVRAKLAQNRAEVAALNANHGATRADFDALFKRQDADRQALTEKAVAYRVQIGKLLTESEWQALHKLGAEALDADLKQLAS